MRIGFHISISGGFAKAAEQANALQCETLQIFTHNPRAWHLKELNVKEIEEFKNSITSFNLTPTAVHMPYLPNLASFDKALYLKSIDALCKNIERAQQLGATYLVLHPGNHGQHSMALGIDRIAKAINKALDTTDLKCTLLLENTSGQGTEVGHEFTQLKSILRAVNKQTHIGICFDTAHAFASGHDLSTKKGLDRTLEDFDRVIGIDKLRFLHLNDSKTPLGSRSDRHWHIGKGYIGIKGFRHILNHPFLKNLSGVMETPGTTDEENLKNMETLKKLCES